MTGEVDSFNIKTNNIEWSMEQYQRNREPFSWKIISEEEIND